eukprot:s2316_g3.t1
MVLQRLPAVIHGGFINPLADVYLATSAYIALQKATRPKPGLAGAPQWIRDILADHSRFSLKRPYSYTGTTAELAAFGTILRRLIPGLLQLPLFAGLQENHQTFEKALEHQAPLKLRWREEKERPMHDLADSFLLVNAMRILSGSRGRSFVLTLDRAAALAAGDAKAAASALLRARRLIPARLAKADLDETLASFVESAHENVWNFRQQALLKNPPEPPPAVRVAELLHWAKTDSGKRLIALADVRRHGGSGVQWPENEELWRPSAGYTAIGGLLLLPLLTPIDAVRWASWCTMSLTVFGLMLPMLHMLGAPSLPAPALLSLGSLLLYCLIAGSIWWNHLLGGARRWAILSGQLASQLVDQADAAAGIAFLTRDWAEMARRSLVALDQELCGSWRTSLHELASKLADLRQELEDSHPPPSNGIQKSIRDGYSSVPAEEDGMPQRLVQPPSIRVFGRCRASLSAKANALVQVHETSSIPSRSTPALGISRGANKEQNERPTGRRLGSHEQPGSRHLSRLLRSEGLKERAANLHEQIEQIEQIAEDATGRTGPDEDLHVHNGQKKHEGQQSATVDSDGSVARNVKKDASKSRATGLSSRKLISHTVKAQDVQTDSKASKEGSESDDDDDPPQDCEYADWEKWSECSESCGGGSKSRTRDVKQEGENGGTECKDSEKKQTQERTAFRQCCLQDWSKCTPDCSGKRSRFRTIIQAAKYGGEACGDAKEDESCDGVCTDCEYQDGNMTRQRSIKTPPSNGGAACGAQNETKACSNFCMNCRWDDWSPWTNCSSTCAGGKTNRSRDQTLVMPKAAASTAAGALLEAEPVVETATAATAAAAKAEKVYGFELKVNKMCDKAHQDAKSLSLSKAKEQCQADANCFGLFDAGCDGKEVAFCSSGFVQQPQNASCTYTKKALDRRADSPTGTDWHGLARTGTDWHGLARTGTDWHGLARTYRVKDLSPRIATQLLVRGTASTVTGASGRPASLSARAIRAVPERPRLRPRDCGCDVTFYRVLYLLYLAKIRSVPFQVQEAVQRAKACGNFCMNCQVTEWTDWTSCSKSCDGGSSKRTRNEMYVSSPNSTGLSLLELSIAAWGYEKKLNFRCNKGSLGADTGKSPAEAEALCSADDNCEALYDEGCHGVLQVCKKGATFEDEDGSCIYSKKEIGKGKPCDGNISQIAKSLTGPSGPSASHSAMAHRQDRVKVTAPSAFGGSPCGKLNQSKACSNVCEECKWSHWSAWAPCSKTCSGRGVQNRTRFIAVAAVGEGVKNCSGDASQMQGCNLEECPSDCQYEDWDSWSTCKPFCKGSRKRTRTVRAEPTFGGAACSNLSQTEDRSNICTDCVWSVWTKWSPCSTTCGAGSQELSTAFYSHCEIRDCRIAIVK